MKVRFEKEGIHFYDRRTGTHILFDEVIPSDKNITVCPRTVSVAITNKCNLCCSYCHIEKGDKFLSKDYILELARTFDHLGAFDIAIGGGEPFLHPDLNEIIRRISCETNLGLSVTTNGTLLTQDKVKSISHFLPIIRISIDGIASTFRTNRQYSFDRIENNLSIASNFLRVGINVVIKDDTVDQLDAIAELYYKYACSEILLLPYIKNGRIALKQETCHKLENWIAENHTQVNLRILSQAKERIKTNYLINYPGWEESYVYIDANNMLKANSYSGKGIKIRKLDEMPQYLQMIKSL